MGSWHNVRRTCDRGLCRRRMCHGYKKNHKNRSIIARGNPSVDLSFQALDIVNSPAPEIHIGTERKRLALEKQHLFFRIPMRILRVKQGLIEIPAAVNDEATVTKGQYPANGSCWRGRGSRPIFLGRQPVCGQWGIVCDTGGSRNVRFRLCRMRNALIRSAGRWLTAGHEQSQQQKGVTGQ